MASDDEDPRVKDLLGKRSEAEGGSGSLGLDDATRAELEKWFGLPSFQELEDQAAPPEDDEWAEARKQRAEALAAVDPGLLEWHRRRNEREDLVQFTPGLTLHVERAISHLDTSLVDRRHAIAEPREVMLPYELENDLRDCAPQALLRDLHRPEMEFEKYFEVVDVNAENRVDVAAEIRAVLAVRPGEAGHVVMPYRESTAIVERGIDIRRRSWTELFAEQRLPNRYIDVPEEDR